MVKAKPYSLKYFIFTWIQCTCSLSHKQCSVEYFGTNSCRNIPFSCVLSAHITPKAKQYSIFKCIECTYHAEGKTIFSKVFQHKPLPLHLHVYWVNILLWRQNNILQNISAPTTAKILYFHLYWVCILLQRQSNILRNTSAPTAAEIFHFHVYWVRILLWRQRNILRNISASTTAEIFRFYVYWVHILCWRQDNILRNISASTGADIFHFHTAAVHMFPQPQTKFPGAFRC